MVILTSAMLTSNQTLVIGELGGRTYTETLDRSAGLVSESCGRHFPACLSRPRLVSGTAS